MVVSMFLIDSEARLEAAEQDLVDLWEWRITLSLKEAGLATSLPTIRFCLCIGSLVDSFGVITILLNTVWVVPVLYELIERKLELCETVLVCFRLMGRRLVFLMSL